MFFTTQIAVAARTARRTSSVLAHALPALLAATGSISPLHAAHAQALDGARLYAEACAACHGSDGRGRTSAEVGFEQRLPNFADCNFAAREADNDWSATIHGGGRARGFDHLMPAFGRALSDEEIDAIIGYMRSFCGDPRWPRGDLNVPRALFTEKAFPEDEATVTTTIVTDGPDSIMHEFNWEKRFGRVSQVEINVPVERADLGDPGWKSGVGDIAIGVKHTLAHSIERGSILAIGGEVGLPTGDGAKGFGTGSTTFESFVLYDKLLPRNAFLQLQGIAEFPQAAALENEVSMRAALGRTWTTGGPFGRAWTPMIEVMGAHELNGGAPTEWDVVPQFQVSLSRRQHLLAAAGYRMPVTERAGRPNEFLFYLLWDWFDGGLREGW